ncbi:PPE family protein [Mycobacterium heidelbergense]|uniref:PPE family protein n=1 Tax=Mycobacterium heidelbergense TaxID=53376 RepID=UPI003CEB2FD8
MTYPCLPPEINSARMQTGAGPGPMRAASSAWRGLAGELRSAANSFASVTSNLSGETWQGPAAAAMAAAAAPYAAWLSAAAGHTERAATQAAAVAASFETAHAATVPTPAIAANRALLVTLVSTNFLGLNTPAIAATESHYDEMWAQDVTAMAHYHAGASSAWAGMAPLTPLQARLPQLVAT